MLTNKVELQRRMLNLTSHAIKYRTAEGDVIFPASYANTRVRERIIQPERFVTVDSRGQLVEIDFDIVKAELLDLPDQRDGVMLIASVPVAQLASRPDVIAPDTYRNGIRDAEGKVVAVTRFRTFQKF